MHSVRTAMRRRVQIVIITIVGALTIVFATADAGVHRAEKDQPQAQSETNTTEAIHHLTRPWPFHRHEMELAVDTDGDGIHDGLDKCANTPKGAKVDARGCPLDKDGDGVFDGIDKCPGTPKGVKVDATGCPIDTDGDGVYDGLDKCPGTPKGARIDADGCPVAESKVEEEFLDTGMISTSQIKFASDKDIIKPEAYPILDKIGAVLAKWSDLKMEIVGHTDSQGPSAHNQDLSERRAKAVSRYLLDKFSDIKADNIKLKGAGEDQPIASNSNKAGRAQNRRVEFKVVNLEKFKRKTNRQ